MEIQNLTVSEKIMLAEALWDSLVEEDSCIDLTDEQKKELDRRLSAFEIDGEAGSDWTAVRARIAAKS
ncbi:MAG: addiction module protein [Pseudomonadales bacterium]|nr:addiction module protein [Pseudomonadales bacterium]